MIAARDGTNGSRRNDQPYLRLISVNVVDAFTPL